MELRQALSLLLLATAATSAAATSTMCRFSRPADAPLSGFEFLGYGEVQQILFHTPQGPRSLPHGSYEVLEFDEPASRIHLVYRNPGDPGLPPDFTLEGAGDTVRVSIDGVQFTGELSCGFSERT